jgi:hypothetical protein
LFPHLAQSPQGVVHPKPPPPSMTMNARTQPSPGFPTQTSTPRSNQSKALLRRDSSPSGDVLPLRQERDRETGRIMTHDFLLANLHPEFVRDAIAAEERRLCAIDL